MCIADNPVQLSMLHTLGVNFLGFLFALPASSSDGPRKRSSPLPPPGIWPYLELPDLTWSSGSALEAEETLRTG